NALLREVRRGSRGTTLREPLVVGVVALRVRMADDGEVGVRILIEARRELTKVRARRLANDVGIEVEEQPALERDENALADPLHARALDVLLELLGAL